jgi:hypothetical protein
MYVDHMIEVFREVRRVLRKDGTVWLNLGDGHAATLNGRSAVATKLVGRDDRTFRDKPIATVGNGLKPKDLCLAPARVALELQQDGWYVRSDIVWAKPNPMPESVTDRPTRAHEYVFLLTKSDRYFYDSNAIREPSSGRVDPIRNFGEVPGRSDKSSNGYALDGAAGRNRRSVWVIATEPYPEGHFATMPAKLVEPCVLAGTSAKGCCDQCGAPWLRLQERVGPMGERVTVPAARRFASTSSGRPLMGNNAYTSDELVPAASALPMGWRRSPRLVGWRLAGVSRGRLPRPVSCWTHLRARGPWAWSQTGFSVMPSLSR